MAISKLTAHQCSRSVFTGTVLYHLINPGAERTLCGRDKGRMTGRLHDFDSRDCTKCARSAERRERKNVLRKGVA